jgi:hypothetical protein
MGFQINPNITLQSLAAEKREAAADPYRMREFAPLYRSGDFLVGGFDDSSDKSRASQLNRALCDEPVQDTLGLPAVASPEAMSRLREKEVRDLGGLMLEVTAENGLVFARLINN